MSGPETSHAGEALRSAHVPPSRRRPVTVVATFLLATAFVLAGAPAAPAAPAATAAPTNNRVQSNPDGFAVSRCGGHAPGICPF